MIKVIIVDDEPLVRMGLKSLVNWEENGFSIEGEASNGREALEMVNQSNPDIIITDIKMPVMDGIGFLKEVSMMKNKPELIVLSCFDDFHLVKEAMKLGAADYLIKSDIKPQQLVDTLSGLKQKIEAKYIQVKKNVEFNDSFCKSISYLKENFFKDLINGFLKKEEAIGDKRELYGIKLNDGLLALIKIKIDDFLNIKKVYIEKDERLLRIALVNILEEIIPCSFNKEILIENSNEYVVIMNLKSNKKEDQNDLDKLCRNIISTVKDFLNFSLSIGLSSIFSGMNNIKEAYEEADCAVNMRFFYGKGGIYRAEEQKSRNLAAQKDIVLNEEAEKELKGYLLSMDRKKVINKLTEIYHNLTVENCTEVSVKKFYIRLVEIITAVLPLKAFSWNHAYTPYEEILSRETMSELNDYVLNFVEIRFRSLLNEELNNSKSYIELVMEEIKNHYSEDISLHSVAAKININPSYLSRIFKQETGENFISYLTKIRIDKAKQYLETGKLKVYEVAERVGYQNPTYFSRLFKKMTGISPEEYS